jgi:hypothetical protein
MKWLALRRGRIGNIERYKLLSVIVSPVVSVSHSRASARYARTETVRRDSETVTDRDHALSTSTVARLHRTAERWRVRRRHRRSRWVIGFISFLAAAIGHRHSRGPRAILLRHGHARVFPSRAVPIPLARAPGGEGFPAERDWAGAASSLA